jgi:hypothetical protein
LAISDDGNLLLVGAPGEDSNATGVDGLQSDNSASDSGAAYVFARTGAVWSQQSYLKASNTGASDSFGTSVALSGDGGTLAVGADLEDGGVAGVNGSQSNNNTPNSGAVYTFSRSGSTWVQQAYIKASNPGNNYEFGSPLAISNDGNTLAVGSPYEQSSSKGINGAQTDAGLYSAGAAYVFVRSGSLWTQQAYVKASNTEYGDSFATSLALDGAGSRLVVGAPHESGSVGGVGGDQSDNNLTGAGAAYVYDRTGSTWAQTLYVKASNPGLNDYFGYTVALSDNGNTMAIAAFEEDSAAVAIGGDQNSDNAPDAGAVYVFLRGNAGWMQKSYIKASNTSPVDRFGSSLALSGDGGRLVVGAVDEDSKASGIGGDQLNEEALESGAVYLY